MIRLHQTFGAHTGRVIELDRDVIRFGRLPDNEVAFDPHADLDASGRHAEIRREGGQWVLVDVGSRNGTLVGGRRVTRHVLRSGDEIEFGLGGPRVRVEILAGSPQAPIGARAGMATAAATPVGEVSAPSAPGWAAPGWAGAAAPPPHPTPPPSPFAGGVAPLHAGHPAAAVPASPVPAMHASPAPLPAAVAPGALGTAPTEEADRRYGQRTVGMMIQAALQRAAEQHARGGHRSTAFLRAIAAEAAQRSSRGLKVAVALLGVLLFLTLGAVVALFVYARWQEQKLRDENVRLQRELAELDDGETAERRRLEQRIQELNEQIHADEGTEGARVAEVNDQAVYVVLVERDDRREVVCSAFAVRPDLLATSARCVGAIERAMSRGQSVSIAGNRGRQQPYRVRQMWRHPAFVDGNVPSPDVGLVRVDRPMPSTVRLATMSEIAELRTGDDVFVFGFPEQIAGRGAPVAVLTSGVVGRMTGFDGNEADPAGRHLISHSAFTDTAGSPVFDRRGRVVGINAGNYRARMRVVDPSTRISRTLDTEAPYAWAVRVDLLLQLLAGMPP